MAGWALLFISVMISNIVVITSESISHLFIFSPNLLNYNIGGAYEQVTMVSYLECARACTDDDSCKTFSYTDSTCHLYNTWPCNQGAPVQTGRKYYKKEEKESAPVVIDCGIQKKDILFLLDSSSSVNGGQFGHQTNFVNHTLSYFNLDSDKIQVAMATYNDIARETFFLNNFTDAGSAQAAALAAVRVAGSGGTPREDLALQFAFDTVFQSNNGDRADADNVIIFITDDKFTNNNYMTKVNMFGNDTEFFAIGVGGRPSREELEEIASHPDAEHVFELGAFNELPNFSSTAFTFACSQCPPCLNQGTCKRTLGRCLCPAGYIGERCESCLD